MSWLLSPLSWLLLAALMGAGAWFFRSRWLAAGSAIIAVVAFAGATPLVGNKLLARLERPIAGAPGCDVLAPDTVVVLAGGVDRFPRSRTDFSVMNQASKRRMERGVQYWQERDGRRIVITGGALGRGRFANADLMVEYAHWLGVPAEAVRTERHSANTHQNAHNLAALAPPIPRRIALVTSAAHMPRAKMEFQAAGFEICPLSADRRSVRARGLDALVPRASALVKTQAALHELAGISYYHWRNWRSRDQSLAAGNEPWQ